MDLIIKDRHPKVVHSIPPSKIGKMTEDEQDLESFLEGFGISKEELHAVMFELDSYRTIPGTTLGKYIKRVLITIEEDDRPAFLKGLLMGIAIRRLIDKIQNEDIVL